MLQLLRPLSQTAKWWMLLLSQKRKWILLLSQKNKWMLLFSQKKKWIPLKMTTHLKFVTVISLQLKKWEGSMPLRGPLLPNHLLLRPLPQFHTSTAKLSMFNSSNVDPFLIPTGSSLTVTLPLICSSMENSFGTSTLLPIVPTSP